MSAAPRPDIRRPLRLGLALAIAAGALGQPADAIASAFFVREQSAAALGSAFAGATAGAEDISYMFYNSAVPAFQDGDRVAVVGTVASSNAKFRDGRAETSAGTPLGGGEGGANAGGVFMIPAFYAMLDLGRRVDALDGVRLAMAVNAPFAFESEYQPGWIGRYYAIQSRVRSVDVNPVVAWKVLPGVAVGIGLQAQYLDAKLTNAIDFGSIGAGAVGSAVPGAQDGSAKLVGDDLAFGWTAGVLLEPRPGTRFGLSFRSAVSHQVRGDGRIGLDSAGTGAALGFTGGTTGAEADLTTPEVAALGIRQRLDEDWTVMADVTWTRWSRIRNLRVHFEDPSVPDDVTEEDWRDTWYFAGGCSWRPAEGWLLRTGVAWDQSPARNRTRTPRTPINSGLLLALGASWDPLPPLSVAAGYSHTFIESARIDLNASDPGNAARGDLSGSSDNSVDVFSLQLQWRF